MNNRLMIRLIDIALIILLGFISISRLKTEYVDLPNPGRQASIRKDNYEATLLIRKNSYLYISGGKSRRVNGLKKLETVLVNEKRKYAGQTGGYSLIIKPQGTSIMQSLIDVLDICQRNRIEKRLDYENIE